MKKLFLYALCAIALSACHTKPTQPKVDSAAVYKVPDEEAINKAVDNVMPRSKKLLFHRRN